MLTTQVVRCPNCGSLAERHYFTGDRAAHQKCPGQQLIQTECQTCDYLMVTCSVNGTVIEAYAPGIPSRTSNFTIHHSASNISDFKKYPSLGNLAAQKVTAALC